MVFAYFVVYLYGLWSANDCINHYEWIRHNNANNNADAVADVVALCKLALISKPGSSTAFSTVYGIRLIGQIQGITIPDCVSLNK